VSFICHEIFENQLTGVKQTKQIWEKKNLFCFHIVFLIFLSFIILQYDKTNPDSGL